jgi:hypothetical protein
MPRTWACGPTPGRYRQCPRSEARHSPSRRTAPESIVAVDRLATLSLHGHEETGQPRAEQRREIMSGSELVHRAVEPYTFGEGPTPAVECSNVGELYEFSEYGPATGLVGVFGRLRVFCSAAKANT